MQIVSPTRHKSTHQLAEPQVEPLIPTYAAKADIDALLDVIDTKNSIIEKKSDVIEAQKKRIAILEEY